MINQCEFTIELRGIRKTFQSGNSEIFRDFSLTVRTGEVVAIVGPSGSGKTTLLNICALLDDVQEGDVLIEGEPHTASQVGTISLAYIFQRDALLPWRTVLENTLLGAQCQGRATPQLKAQAMDILARFGLKGYEYAYPSTLSGGQRQRVAIAQNLLISPHILLLDEPFASLDFQTKLVLEEELLRVIHGDLNGQKRRTVLLVTHDIEEALVLADRVIVLGRHNDEPAHIAMDLPVELASDERDPAKARESHIVRESFERIWSTIKPYVLRGRQ